VYAHYGSNLNTMPYEREYVTPSGMTTHGWTPAAIARFLGEPDDLADNPHYRRAAPMRLYKTERVLAAEQTPEFRKWLGEKKERKAKGATASERRFAKFERKYSDLWKSALPDACAFLFDLNRYAKHQACTAANRDEIYSLKNSLIRLLYTNGFCNTCYVHNTELPAQPCWSCGGTGIWASEHSDDDWDGDDWDGDDWDDTDEDCRKCKGTGIYRKPKALAFLCFRFAIGEKTFCWHQPKKSVSFVYKVTAAECSFALTDEEKPISLDRRKFAEAKHLLMWVIERATGKEAVAA
jgi:hypothetical protein